MFKIIILGMQLAYYAVIFDIILEFSILHTKSSRMVG